MILWTDWIAVLLVSVVALILLRLMALRLQVLDSLYRILQIPLHQRQAQMIRRFQLALMILLPLVWILLLIGTVR
jgi:hypothetical protein